MSSSEVFEDHVISKDGTRIAYLRRGSGPAIVLVQAPWAQPTTTPTSLASSLRNPRYTLPIDEDAGQDLNFTIAPTIARNVEDLEAVLEEAGGWSMVLGLSSGAMITLEAAKTLERMKRAAAYEPPFYPGGISHEGIRELNSRLRGAIFRPL